MRVKTLHPRCSPLRKGYLLLEVTLALAITGIILVVVFQVTEWNLRVSNDSIENSNKQMTQSAFFSYMDRAFQQLPGDVKYKLTSTETQTHYLSEFVIQNGGQVFSWPGQTFASRAVKFVTRPNRDNTLDILLEYYAYPLIVDDYERVIDPEDERQEPVETLVLLKGVWRFEWRAWDGLSVDRDSNPAWLHEWEQPNLPRYFELNAVFDSEDQAIVHTFWSPMKVNPYTASQRFNQ